MQELDHLRRQMEDLTQLCHSLVGQVNQLTGQVNSLTGQSNALTGIVNQIGGSIADLHRTQAGAGQGGATAGRLLSAPNLPVRYRGERVPAEFRFQDPKAFLWNGTDMEKWEWTERAPFITEAMSRGRHEFFATAAGYIRGAGIEGDYHEYGCFSANTFRTFLTQARIFGFDFMRFYAFDSFEGLPEVDAEVSLDSWTKGAMAMSEEEFWKRINAHGVYVDRVESIKGFFDRSLTAERQASFVQRPARIALAAVDCDLYESAVPVFSFIAPLLQDGTLIYIDDYYVGYRGSPERGVARAFHEFERRSEFKFQPYVNVGWWGKSFVAYRSEAARA